LKGIESVVISHNKFISYPKILKSQIYFQTIRFKNNL
jgi:hypothetical protein